MITLIYYMHFSLYVYSIAIYFLYFTIFLISGYINSYDNFFSYVCPNNGLLNGFRSVYDIYYRDRRWEVQCCPIISKYKVPFKITYTSQVTYSYRCLYRIVMCMSIVSNFTKEKFDKRWIIIFFRTRDHRQKGLTSLNHWMSYLYMSPIDHEMIY